ncbi:MAG TPA: biotin--[acetyl-CoA-carboxylase] ligase [Lachnospiraceae bacterium]|nr:biotin--[acetyl-CoA-carboxylase] ligase [Lachnospiraceae bacterium]
MKNKLLELLKTTNGYLSGENIGELLGVSRTAVWKYIKILREEGYNIQAVTNKGYCLMPTDDVLSSIEVKLGLNTKTIGTQVIYFDTVDSTNNKLRLLALEGAAEGTVVIADEQLGGKGRRGHVWSSPKGTGLWMSVLLKPNIAPQEASRITLVAGLSVCQAINDVLGINSGIKWPNDIIIDGKKVCGILTEMNAQINNVEFVVVGIGVNVNTDIFPEELKDIAVSLSQIAGVKVKRSKIARAIIERLEQNYNKYTQKGFLSVKEEYENRCITINKNVKVISKDGFNGRAIAINDDGELIVEKADGERVTVFSGEVSIRGV